jgi:hypothetical protein
VVQQMTYEVRLPLAFYYETKTPLPIPDVIKALSALDRLSIGIPAFFTSLSGVNVDSCVLEVEKVESGSLKEYLDLALFFLTQAEKDKFENWLKTTKMGNALRYTAVAGVAAAAFMVIAASGITLVDKVAGNKAPSIQATNSVVMVAGQDMFGVNQPDLDKAITAALSRDKKRIASAAVDFVKPAAGLNGGKIFAGDDNSSPLQISHAAAKDTPDKAIMYSSGQDLPFQNVDVDIRTLNRDSDKAGWVARLPTVAKNKKLPMQFEPGVDIRKAQSNQIIKADVLVSYDQDPDTGALIPKSFIVKAIY